MKRRRYQYGSLTKKNNKIITAYICKEVGIPVEHLLLGSQIEGMSETALAEADGKADQASS